MVRQRSRKAEFRAVRAEGRGGKQDVLRRVGRRRPACARGGEPEDLRFSKRFWFSEHVFGRRIGRCRSRARDSFLT